MFLPRLRKQRGRHHRFARWLRYRGSKLAIVTLGLLPRYGYDEGAQDMLLIFLIFPFPRS